MSKQDVRSFGRKFKLRPVRPCRRGPVSAADGRAYKVLDVPPRPERISEPFPMNA